MRRPRLRSALLAAAVLGMGVPALAQAEAPALHCTGIRTKGFWQTIHVAAFKPVASLASPDTVSGYTVDRQKPQDIAVTNGVRVQISTDHGCDWVDSLELSSAPSTRQTFLGTSAKIVSLAMIGSTHVAAVQEGIGAASRPHIMVGSGSDWTTADSGLPLQGSPKLLRAASDGRTLYLTVSPTDTGGDSGTTSGVPGLPVTGGGGSGGTPTGLLYASTDRGHSWTLRTTAADLPSGGVGFSTLEVDPTDGNRLYGLINGQLAVSGNGGGSFTRFSGGFTAVTAIGPLTVGAFTSDGRYYYSANGGSSFTNSKGLAGVTSAAARSGDSTLMVEQSGRLVRFTPFANYAVPLPATAPARTGSLLGDFSSQGSFHALSGHSLLRFADPTPTNVKIPPVADGDKSVPPPVPGTVVPAVRAVTLPVGQSTTVPFTLDLPKNPTPLDLFFLVDASGSMSEYIKDLKANLRQIVASLQAQKIDLAVGVGTLGSGERAGEAAYPLTYVYPTDPSKPYVRPQIYRRIYPVGPTGQKLQDAIDNITIESDDVPSYLGGGGHEGQLLALKDMSDGLGIERQKRNGGGYAVKPGTDARWRGSADTRRIVIAATDEQFDNPYPQKGAQGSLDFGPALRALKAARTQVIGMTAGSYDSAPDLQRLARGTGSLTPPGGVYCGIDPNNDSPENLKPGDPLVCNSGAHFSEAIIRLLSSLVDRQTVKLVPLTTTPVLGAAQGSALTGLNVKKPNAAPFTVNVSCVNVKPGRYGGDVAAVLRGTKVGQAHVQVTCVKDQAAVPPRPLPPAVNPPAPPAAQPAPPAVPPLAPPAPAVQPQVQIQTQVQVNPMSAGAVQEQQELQLALALNGTLKDDDPAFSAGAQLAMVDRRKREQVQALYVLATAMTACAGLGLARLRSRPDLAVRRAS